MIPTTTLARDGDTLFEAVHANAWYSYLDGYEPAALVDDLVGALLDAQQAAFNELLPDRCYWHRSTAEIVGPVGTELVEDVDVLLQRARDTVVARFDEIETGVKAAAS